MRLDRAEHLKHPWRVHELAADFELLDVWEYPFRADATAGEDFALFCRMLDEAPADPGEPPVGGVAGLLFRLRAAIGRVLRLDEPTPRPIPGCEEASVRDRLAAADRTTSTTDRGPSRPGRSEQDRMGFREVYRADRELLKEISNRTVHALLHIGWVQKEGSTYTPQLAVYAKHRGRLSRLYMTLIGPFRHFVVYPALMRSARRSWEALTAHPLRGDED